MTKFDEALKYVSEEIGKWEYCDYISKIYLYGSCARNEQRVDSDVDLYIELEQKVPVASIRELKILCNPSDWRLPEVDVKVGYNGRLDNSADLFSKNIRKDGVLLWEKL